MAMQCNASQWECNGNAVNCIKSVSIEFSCCHLEHPFVQCWNEFNEQKWMNESTNRWMNDKSFLNWHIQWMNQRMEHWIKWISSKLNWVKWDWSFSSSSSSSSASFCNKKSTHFNQSMIFHHPNIHLQQPSFWVSQLYKSKISNRF